MSDDREAREPIVARSRGWLIAVGIAIGLSLAVVLQLGACAREDLNARLRYDFCRESNVPNAYIRLVLQRSRYVTPRGLPAPSRALPILSCQESAEQGRLVRLRGLQERRYLHIFAMGRLPLVRHGRVVGSDPLPAPPR